jgi:hypothetical protein
MIKGLGTLAAALLAVLAAPASAQVSTTANGPYYATPSWDQKLPTNRFVILANWNNEAVLDRETGLVWERSPDTTRRTWTDNAQFLCNNRSVGGRKGWRLPGVQELASLVDPTVAPLAPPLPASHPFLNVQSSFYWSATSSANNTDYAWAVGFDGSGFVSDGVKSSTNYVWCVRGGQGPDVQ